jgi:hypothetical protein
MLTFFIYFRKDGKILAIFKKDGHQTNRLLPYSHNLKIGNEKSLFFVS